MPAMNAYGVVFPIVLITLALALWLGVRASGAERRPESDLERRLRERTFDGRDRVTLEWPRERRRPSLARLVSFGESCGYRFVGRRDREHVVDLDFERIDDDEGF